MWLPELATSRHYCTDSMSGGRSMKHLSRFLCGTGLLTSVHVSDLILVSLNEDTQWLRRTSSWKRPHVWSEKFWGLWASQSCVRADHHTHSTWKRAKYKFKRILGRSWKSLFFSSCENWSNYTPKVCIQAVKLVWWNLAAANTMCVSSVPCSDVGCESGL